MSMAMACILSITTLDRLDRGDNKGFRKPENAHDFLFVVVLCLIYEELEYAYTGGIYVRTTANQASTKALTSKSASPRSTPCASRSLTIT